MITSIHDYVDIRRAREYWFHNPGSNLYHLIMVAARRCEAIITESPCAFPIAQPMIVGPTATVQALLATLA